MQEPSAQLMLTWVLVHISTGARKFSVGAMESKLDDIKKKLAKFEKFRGDWGTEHERGGKTCRAGA